MLYEVYKVYEAPILWNVMLVTDVLRQYGSLIFKGLKVIFGVFFFRNEVSMGSDCNVYTG